MIMNPASKANRSVTLEAGGYAPQFGPPRPRAPEGFCARAAAHPVSLLVALGVGIAIAASVNAIGPVASRALSQPPVSHYAGSEAVVCSVTSSGVCAMRVDVDENGAMKITGAGTYTAPWTPKWPALKSKVEATPVEKITTAKPELTVADLTEPEMLAMMQMSRQVREQAIWFKLKQQYSVPPFTLSTFIGLREKGLAYLPEGKRFHTLNWQGDCLAHAVADHLQKKFNVHQSYLLGRTRATVTLKCTCQWGCAIRAGNKMQEKADRAMTSHLRSVIAMNDLVTALAPHHQGSTGET